MTISVEFEGGCVTYDNKKTGAAPVLRLLENKGHDIVLITENTREALEEARKWFKDNGIRILCDNLNTKYIDMFISPKDVSAHLTKGYSDSKPFLDWRTVASILKEKGLFTAEEFQKLETEIWREMYE